MSRHGLYPTVPDRGDERADAVLPSSRPAGGAVRAVRARRQSRGTNGLRDSREEDGAEGGANVEVVVRVRPMLAPERDRGEERRVRCDGRSVSVQMADGTDSTGGARGMTKDFAFQAVVPEDAGQAEFFEASGAKRLLDAAMDGYSSTIFAYGQTGCGKTHTIAGPSDAGVPGHEHAGLITRSCEYLAGRAAQLPAGTSWQFRASFLEIYNDQAYDLLNPSAGQLGERWNDTQGHFVENLFVVNCETLDDLMTVVGEGIRNRRVGSHAKNLDSSRSHAIFSVELDINPEGGGGGQADGTGARRGKVALVDLAGSERLKDTKSDERGAQMLREAGHVNRSLFVLGKVIAALAKSERDSFRKSQTSGGFLPPYRDSLLTKLLMDSLGGNSHALMVACVSPCAADYEETLSTLFYASRAGRIRNRPTRRTVSVDEPSEAMRDELDQLRQEVAQLRSRVPQEGAVGTPMGAVGGNFGGGGGGGAVHSGGLPLLGPGRGVTGSRLSTPLATETAALERRMRDVDDQNLQLQATLDDAVAENEMLRQTVRAMQRGGGGSAGTQRSSTSNDGKRTPRASANAVHTEGMSSAESRLAELREDFE